MSLGQQIQTNLDKLGFTTSEQSDLYSLPEVDLAASSDFDAFEKKLHDFAKRTRTEPSAFETDDLEHHSVYKRSYQDSADYGWVKRAKTVEAASDLLTNPPSTSAFSGQMGLDENHWFRPEYWNYIASSLEKHQFNIEETLVFLKQKYRNRKYDNLDPITVQSWITKDIHGMPCVSPQTLETVEAVRAADIVRKAERQKELNKERQKRWRQKNTETLKDTQKRNSQSKSDYSYEKVTALPKADLKNDWFAPSSWSKISKALIKFDYDTSAVVSYLNKRYKDGRFAALKATLVSSWISSNLGKPCIAKDIQQKVDHRAMEDRILKAAQTRERNKARQKRWRDQHRMSRESQ